MLHPAAGGPVQSALAYVANPAPCAARARALNLSPVAVFTGCTLANDVLVAACAGKFTVLVVERLTVLGPRPLDALRGAAQIANLGVRVESAAPDEAWISAVLPALIPAFGWLEGETRRWRSTVIRESAARANRRPGRPRKAIDGAVALTLAERLPLERAAKEIGVGASTLRRWLQARAEEQRLAALTQPPGRAA